MHGLPMLRMMHLEIIGISPISAVVADCSYSTSFEVIIKKAFRFSWGVALTLFIISHLSIISNLSLMGRFFYCEKIQYKSFFTKVYMLLQGRSQPTSTTGAKKTTLD